MCMCAGQQGKGRAGASKTNEQYVLLINTGLEWAVAGRVEELSIVRSPSSLALQHSSDHAQQQRCPQRGLQQRCGTIAGIHAARIASLHYRIIVLQLDLTAGTLLRLHAHAAALCGLRVVGYNREREG